MKLLALDTSSIACSVAVQNGDQVLQRHEEQAREHTRLIMPMIKEALSAASLALHDLDAIVLGNGPGSFIGMRIGASVAQGLAHGAQLTVVPVSSLAAVAAEAMASSDAEEVAVAQDAHMNEVYLGLYSRNKEHLPEALMPERLQACEEISELQLTKKGRAYAGCGWQRYPQLLAANQQYFHAAAKVSVPQARYLLVLASLNHGIAPQDLEPDYLRQSVASIPQNTKS